jgi:hypothetical protein
MDPLGHRRNNSHGTTSLANGRDGGYASRCNSDKAETRTILVPPKRTDRQRVSALQALESNSPDLRALLVDVPGAERKRRTIALGVCATRSAARRKLREHIEAERINTNQTFTSTTAPATTFRAQAAKWIQAVSTRRRKPVKPATISGWQHSLDKWVLPNLGDLHLADVGNAALKRLVEKMFCAGLSPQTIVTHSKVVKMVVASAVNSEGEQIHPRKWNHDFIGLPNYSTRKTAQADHNRNGTWANPRQHERALCCAFRVAGRNRVANRRGACTEAD